MTGAVAHGRARGFLVSARDLEIQGKQQDAALLYHRAAASLLEAAEAAPDARTRTLRRDLAWSMHQRGRRLEGGIAAVSAARPSADAGMVEAPAVALLPARNPTVNFADVVGMEQVKESFRRRILLPLSHPEVYRKYGKTPGGGILLYGPPGCGKTFIAKAAAGESGAAFFPVQLADILDKYVGGSEKALRDVFQAAKAHRPSIIFLDEIDAIGSDRQQQQNDHGRRLLNQLLTLMDGATQDGEHPLDGVLVIGATNIPQALDAALVRPGRFDQRLEIPPPGLDALTAMAAKHLSALGPNSDALRRQIEELGHTTPADVMGWCDEVLLERIAQECEAGELRPEGSSTP